MDLALLQAYISGLYILYTLIMHLFVSTESVMALLRKSRLEIQGKNQVLKGSYYSKHLIENKKGSTNLFPKEIPITALDDISILAMFQFYVSFMDFFSTIITAADYLSQQGSPGARSLASQKVQDKLHEQIQEHLLPP